MQEARLVSCEGSLTHTVILFTSDALNVRGRKSCLLSQKNELDEVEENHGRLDPQPLGPAELPLLVRLGSPTSSSPASSPPRPEL